MGEKIFKAGGTTTETNSRLKQIIGLLNSLLKQGGSIAIGTSSRPVIFDSASIVSALGPLATQATVAAILAKQTADAATEAKQDDVITALGPAATAALQADIESSLNTLITNNTADFITNTAQFATQIALNIAQLALNRLSIIATTAAVIANGVLISISNTRLADIVTATESADTKLTNINTSLNEIEDATEVMEKISKSRHTDAGALAAAVITDTDTMLRVTMDTDTHGHIESVRITNNHASLARTFQLFWDDGSTQVDTGFGTKNIPAGNTDTIIIDHDVRSTKGLTLVASGAADSNEYDLIWVIDGIASDYTYTSS